MAVRPGTIRACCGRWRSRPTSRWARSLNNVPWDFDHDQPDTENPREAEDCQHRDLGDRSLQAGPAQPDDPGRPAAEPPTTARWSVKPTRSATYRPARI